MKTAKDLIIPFAWPDRHPILLDRFFYIPGHYSYTETSIPFFEESRPLVIEYCSGNGQWVGQRAEQNPQLHWIAVEKKFERARQIWLMLHRKKLTNLCVVCGEALAFTRYYAPKAAEFYINFPDPWPKLRHAKHRLVRAEFIRELTQIIQEGGRGTCVTDDLSYAGEIEREFAKCPEWKLLFHTQEWPDYGRSFFNDLWIGKGKVVHYLCYERKK